MRTTTSLRTTTGRRLALGAALLAVFAVGATSGCGGADQPPATAGTPSTSADSGDSGGSGGLGSAGGGSADTGDGTSTDAGTDAGTGTQGQSGGQPADATSFPETAQAYAEAIIAAWYGADQARLAELTTALVHDQITQIPGPPAAGWTLIQCDGGDCQFYNDDGDHLLLHVQPSKLGQPHAANHVTLDAVSFPLNDMDYLEAFVQAWQVGNVARMHALALPQVVGVYQQYTPGQVTNYGKLGGGGGLSVVVLHTASAEIENHVGTTLLGGPQAIRKAVPEL